MTIKKILVVDDSATERHLLGQILKAQKFEVFFAENGEEGVEQAKTLIPDLIIMDVVMPGINGFQATRIITQNHSLQHIPVILCTTKNQETDKVWGIRQGAKDYIIKPVQSADLLEKIKALS